MDVSAALGVAMTVMTALEAKNGFGQFLDAAQREPVTVTKNGRPVGAMFSQPDLEAMAAAYLSGPVLDDLKAGEIGLSTALLRQAALNRRITEAEADIVAGRVHVADEAFFEGIREHIRQVAAKR